MKAIDLLSVDSTNAYLKREYGSLEDLTFVSSVSQSEGRGRSGRRWESEEGKNLTFSYLLKDRRVLERYRELSILSAYSLVKTLKGYGISSMIKWPNDVYVDGHKIAGILLEAISREELECIIVGIGLNVNQLFGKNGYPVEPISMKEILGKDIDIAALKERLYGRIAADLERMMDGHDFYEKIREYDYLKDMKAYALVGNEKRSVEVLGIDRDFTLKVNMDGRISNLESGEISFHI